MGTYDLIFYLFAAITLISAGVVVFSRSIIYSAFSLLFTFSGVAGIYVMLNADFIAITQLLVYVGGILILLLFGVMLTSDIAKVEVNAQTLQSVPATIVVGIVSALLVSTMVTTNWINNTPVFGETTVYEIGRLLLTRYLLPFEIASIVLLVALIGAAFFARRK
jgi:NADH-quinone oxidoreductase subunit J